VGAKILLLENVPAFMSKKLHADSPVRILDLLLEDLRARGFKYVAHDILDASNYGVPQRRSRFILLASKTIPINQKMFNGVGLKEKTTVEQAFSDLPEISDNSISSQYATAPQNIYQRTLRDPAFWGARGSTEGVLTYHIAPKHRKGTLKRFSLIRPGEGLKDLFDRLGEKQVAKLQIAGVLPKKWFISRNQRLISNKQSHTVTSHCLEEIVHPKLNRGPSIREAARLQSFPDHYDFKGGPIIAPHIHRVQDKYEQIGDAVPPLLARHLGHSIVRILMSEKKTK
jgi:DNA (cytosine-5)-methyltransferase 1